MPSYFLEIPDVGTTVQKAVTDNVTRNVLTNMGLKNPDIVYEGEEYREQSQAGTTVGQQRKQSYGSTDRITVGVTETRDASTRIERSPGYNLEEPFFHDRAHNVKLSPSMVKYEVTISVKRRDSSKARIQTWCNEIQRRIDMGNDIFTTQAEFYFHIPTPALNLLKECYETQFFGVVKPYPLVGYLKKNFTNNVTLTSNMSGAGLEYAVRYTELRILGIFDTDGPKEQKGDNFSAWECEFTFTFNYHRPEAVEVVFPIMLNNTLVSREWWLDNLAPGLVDMQDAGVGSFVEAGEHITEPPYLRLPVYIPECDKPDLRPVTGTEKDVTLSIVHLETVQQENGPSLLFNLGEMGDTFVLSDTMLDYIVRSYRTDPTGKDSVFKIYVYENDYVIDYSKIAISPDLDLYLNGITWRERIYRVVILLQLDWKYITDVAFDHLRQSPQFVSDVTDEFNPALLGKYPIDLTRPTIIPSTLDAIIDRLNGIDDFALGMRGDAVTARNAITVHNNTIIAHRRPL